MPTSNDAVFEIPALIRAEGITLAGAVAFPRDPTGVVLFAHVASGNRYSQIDNILARALRSAGLATMRFDLLNETEAADPTTAEDVHLLARRLLSATACVEHLARVLGPAARLPRGDGGRRRRADRRGRGGPQGAGGRRPQRPHRSRQRRALARHRSHLAHRAQCGSALPGDDLRSTAAPRGRRQGVGDHPGRRAVVGGAPGPRSARMARHRLVQPVPHPFDAGRSRPLSPRFSLPLCFRYGAGWLACAPLPSARPPRGRPLRDRPCRDHEH